MVAGILNCRRNEHPTSTDGNSKSNIQPKTKVVSKEATSKPQSVTLQNKMTSKRDVSMLEEQVTGLVGGLGHALGSMTGVGEWFSLSSTSKNPNQTTKTIKIEEQQPLDLAPSGWTSTTKVAAKTPSKTIKAKRVLLT